MPRLAARSGDVARGLGGVLRPADRADRGASHDAGLREHAADGRAGGAAPERAARRRRGHRASRQPVEGEAARRRDAAEGRPAARRSSPPRRSSSASTSATSIWSARSDRRTGSRRCCSASAARATRSPARRRAGCSRCRATTWSSARRCCARSGAASSIASSSHDAPLDVLAQQIVAETACREYARRRAVRARPARLAVSRPRRAPTSTRSSRWRPKASRPGAAAAARWSIATRSIARVRGRRGARLLALTSGGAIPEVADYRVVLEPDDTFIGTLNEDFAIESMRRRRLPARQRVVAGAAGRRRRRCASPTRKGAPPTIPFWLGEAPARSDELSRAVSDLRADVERRLTARTTTSRPIADARRTGPASAGPSTG